MRLGQRENQKNNQYELDHQVDPVTPAPPPDQQKPHAIRHKFFFSFCMNSKNRI